MNDTTTERIRATVVTALVAAAVDHAQPDEVQDTTHIGAGGLGLSSLNVLHALVRIEDELGVQFDDRTVAQTQLSSVGVMVDLVRRAVAEA